MLEKIALSKSLAMKVRRELKQELTGDILSRKDFFAAGISLTISKCWCEEPRLKTQDGGVGT